MRSASSKSQTTEILQAIVHTDIYEKNYYNCLAQGKLLFVVIYIFFFLTLQCNPPIILYKDSTVDYLITFLFQN